MARRCALTGKDVQFEHNVSHSMRATNRRFDPNIQKVTLALEALGREIRLRVATRTLRTVLLSIQSLLSDPNPASPANSEASRLYSENRREYNRRVREIVENSWLDDTAEEDVAEKLPPPQDAGAVAGGPTVAVGQVAAES